MDITFLWTNIDAILFPNWQIDQKMFLLNNLCTGCKNTKDIDVKEHTKDNRIFDVICFIFGGTSFK